MNLCRSILLLLSFFILNFSFIACAQRSSSAVAPLEIRTLKVGSYNHSNFQSKIRSEVNFNVYLPPSWFKEKHLKYPLVILLHGQGEDEHTFVQAFPQDSLNNWIINKLIPEMVIISLRGEDNTNDMQWYFDQNVELITSLGQGELRTFCNDNFNTSMKESEISVIGHSRGATGALHFAVTFPDKFASVVSSAFVSDYAIERLKKAAVKNLNQILESGIEIQMLIGSHDQYVVNHNRQGSKVLSDFFMEKGISHELKIIEGKSHSLNDLWEYPTNLKYLQLCSKAWKINSNN